VPCSRSTADIVSRIRKMEGMRSSFRDDESGGANLPRL
jgi:hypothetical protein